MYLTYSYLFLLAFIWGASAEPKEKMNISFFFAEMDNLEAETTTKQVTSWKNEAILIPIVLKKEVGDPEKVNFSVSSNSSFNIQLAKLEYVLGDLSAGACGANKVKGNFEEAYFPDRVNYLSDLNLDLDHEVNYFLAKVWVAENAKEGKHAITFTIGDSNASMEITAEITVLDKILPEMEELDFKLEFWQFPRSVSNFYKIKPWSQEHMDLLEEQFVQLNKMNQRSITTSVFWDLFNGKPGDKEALMIKCIKKADGGWEYDYSNFEKYVDLGISCGINEQIDVHNLFPWNLTYYYIEEKSGTIKQFKAGPSSEEYKEFWTPFLRDFSVFLEKKGWKEKVVFFIDERIKDHSITLAKFIKEIDPDFKVGYAGKFHPDLSGLIDNYSLPSNVSLNPQELEKREKANKITTFYTACWEKQPNMLMMNNYYDFYFLLMLSKARGYDGFLRWAFNSWGSRIMTDARYDDVPSGDAHFYYPYGQPSIRYELLLDAMEEVHKVTLLSKQKKVRNLLSSFKKQSLLGNLQERNQLVESMMGQVNQ